MAVLAVVPVLLITLFSGWYLLIPALSGWYLLIPALSGAGFTSVRRRTRRCSAQPAA